VGVIIHTRTGDKVASLLRDDIVAGRLKPGQRLGLTVLAARFGVSTTPIREALATLEQEGLVVGEPHKGLRVAELSAEDRQDAYTLHAFIAGILAERAVDRISERELDELQRIEDQIKRATEEGELAAAAELNHAFHRAINHAAGSRLLQRFLAATTPLVTRRRDPFVPGWSDQAVTEHDPIIEACRVHDGPRARRLMEQHILHSGELVASHSLTRDDRAGPEAEERRIV
jgi:DNA-binding GntR family transcriptional regulator